MGSGLEDSVWPAVWYTVGYAYIVIYVALILGYYRTAQVTAALAFTPDLVNLVQQRLSYHQPTQSGQWAGLILLDLAPVLAMAAFHRDAPPVVRRTWLLALPAGFILVAVPMLAAQVTGHLLMGMTGRRGAGRACARRDRARAGRERYVPGKLLP